MSHNEAYMKSDILVIEKLTFDPDFQWISNNPESVKWDNLNYLLINLNLSMYLLHISATNEQNSLFLKKRGTRAWSYRILSQQFLDITDNQRLYHQSPQMLTAQWPRESVLQTRRQSLKRWCQSDNTAGAQSTWKHIAQMLSLAITPWLGYNILAYWLQKWPELLLSLHPCLLQCEFVVLPTRRLNSFLHNLNLGSSLWLDLAKRKSWKWQGASYKPRSQAHLGLFFWNHASTTK